MEWNGEEIKIPTFHICSWDEPEADRNVLLTMLGFIIYISRILISTTNDDEAILSVNTGIPILESAPPQKKK